VISGKGDANYFFYFSLADCVKNVNAIPIKVRDILETDSAFAGLTAGSINRRYQLSFDAVWIDVLG
jgi:hypothetical protein